jgi:hypothetical protein
VQPSSSHEVLPIAGKRRRKAAMYQVYQTIGGPALNGKIKTDYEEYKKNLSPGTKPQKLIAYRNARANELLKEETDDVKDTIRKAWEKAPGARTTSKNLEIEGAEDMSATELAEAERIAKARLFEQ